MKVVLALRALNLGDLLVAVPALRALHGALPDHRLVLATPAVLAPLVELVGAVAELLPTDEPGSLRWRRPAPDLAVNLHGTGPQSHRALDALAPRRRIGFRPAPGAGEWDARGWDGPRWVDVAARHAHERERWCALLAHQGIPADPADLRLPPPAGVDVHGGGGPVLVHPGAAFGSKRWPARRFGEVAAALGRGGDRVLVTGSAGERDLAAAVAGAAGLPDEQVLAGRTDLARLCALVAGAALVISGDTGVAHLASAFGTPSVVLFGPVGPAQWGPPADGPHLALDVPEARRGEPFADDPDPALLAVQVSDVLRAAEVVRDRPIRRSTEGLVRRSPA